MVGREVERAFADVLVAEVARGSPRALLVRGEPGIGKSLLLEHLADRAEAAGFLVLAGRTAERAQDLPFAALVDALDAHLAAVADELALPRVVRVQLSAVLPALADHPGTAEASGERSRLYRAVGVLLETLAAAAPLLLVLDDAHRADPATVELVDHLLRHPPDARVLLAVALRPRHAPPGLLRTLCAVERSGGLHTVELGPLPADDADALLGAVSGPDRVRIIAESGGNPFYLRQLARSRGGVPPAIAASLREELRAVPAPASLLLSAAAVVGDPFDIGLAAAGAALPDSEALDLLDELCRRDLVRPTEVPRRFAFRHPVLRRAVYGSAGPGWRRAARARAADALRGPAAVPTHLVGRTAAAANEVVPLLSGAATVTAGAPGTAALRLRRPEDLYLLGEALAALPDPSSVTATRLRVAIGTVHLWGSDHAQAWHWARRAHSTAQDPLLRGAAAALVAGAASRAGAVAEARSAACEATALLDPLPDDAVTVQLDTLLLLGCSEIAIERPQAACAHLRRALVLADRTGQAHLLPEVRYGLAAALTWSGELTEAACAGDDAIDAALSDGAVDSHLWALWTRCTTAIVAGDLAAASRLGEEAWGLAQTTPGNAATLPGVALAEVRLAAGEHEAGTTALQDVAGGPDLPRIAQVDRPYWFALLAEAGIRSGRRAEATGWAERAERASEGLELDGRTGWALRAAAAVRNAHREHARAADLALRSAELLGRAGNPVEAARSRTLAGTALGAAGYRSRARAELTAAAAVLERCGAAGHAAETVALLRGIHCRSSGAGSTAREVLSPREHQIAQLVATGRTNREIAEELLLSVKTVETHLGRAFGKLGVPTRSALAAHVRAGA